MKNVAFITHSLDRAGSETSLLDLSKILNNYKQIVITAKDGPMRACFDELRIPVIICERSKYLNVYLILKLFFIYKRNKTHIVHLNTATSYNKYAAIAAYLCNLPIIWHIRDDVGAKGPRKLIPWIKFFSTKIIPVSQEIAIKLHLKGNDSRLKVLHNTIDTHLQYKREGFLKNKLGLKNNAILIGGVGSIEPRKGIEDLIKAVSMLNKKNTKVNIVWIGKDRNPDQSYRQHIQELAERLGISSNLYLIGDISDTLRHYPEFDFFVLPSKWEGCARVLLEAMLHGCPIISSNAGGNTEVISDGITGYIYPAGNVKELANSLSKMIQNPEAAVKLGIAARNILCEKFNYEKYRNDIISIYKTL
jgi:glycosyltransferase involved in cell wall biosynthesis